MTLASLSRSLLRTAATALILATAACATPSGDSANDPIEPVNRAIWGFNEGTDILLVRPATEVYVNTVPDPIREVVHNFLVNLTMPLVIANQLLQGDGQGAIDATGRFLTNTILGAGGIADVATAARIPYESEDFGQTLAVWGLGDGPYLVLPLLGPSGLRDATGLAVDTVADPVRIAANAGGAKGALYGRAGATTIDTRSQYLGTIDDIRRNSVDPYASLRSLYRQRRQVEINDGKGTPAEQPDFPADPAAPKR
ncbi:VacJ family lipoprotein [Azospirillum sp.]|uniref:MlaA family lipoprotein n=1 Tax=Azospirillum sp. TaxID=34012 RepID=UPI002D4BEAA5|nr:VacJ family lipoprotein [Azospirillum sp.]HYD64782.1 VacJ family lipoprotein [Azospirillum sp.]